MLRLMCKSKIHGATVTDTNLRYEGSLTLDETLMEAADILPYERVQVVNLNNGERLETYVMPGKRGSGVVCLNGPAARLGQVGDKVHIISYCILPQKDAKKWKPRLVAVNEMNRLERK